MWKTIIKKDIDDILDRIRNEPFNEELWIHNEYPSASMTIGNFIENKHEILGHEMPDKEIERAVDEIVEEYYAKLTLDQIKDEDFDFDEHLFNIIDEYIEKPKFNNKFRELNKREE
tara:strand:- start:3712 stop:4059 length:348 start_codon:yes stop_codon:yes gene_type:complete